MVQRLQLGTQKVDTNRQLGMLAMDKTSNAANSGMRALPLECSVDGMSVEVHVEGISFVPNLRRVADLPPVSMSAHLHMQLSLSTSLVLKSAPWITRLLSRPAVPVWLFRNNLQRERQRKRDYNI